MVLIILEKNAQIEKFFVGPYGCSTHPHNIYLQLLAETGVLGFIFLILIFLKIVIYSFKHFYIKYFKRKNYLLEYEVALLTCMLINFWPLSLQEIFLAAHLEILQ
jgi:O-antigen ligase